MSSTIAATVIATLTSPFPKQDALSASKYGSQTAVTLLVTWTNLGPLTTTFTAPSSCSTTPLGELWAYRTSDGLVWSSVACDFWSATGPHSWANCQPSVLALSSLWATTTSAYWLTYLSPGLYCPSAYSTATALTLTPQDVITGTYNGFLLRTTGTHVYCCPRYAIAVLSEMTHRKTNLLERLFQQHRLLRIKCRNSHIDHPM